MSIFKTDAFVLKSFKYGETSKIVTLFTEELGKIDAIVKGARNFKSKLCGTLESMNYISAVIYYKENRELQLITNAEYRRSFKNILCEIEKLEAAYKIIDILGRSVLHNDVNKKMFEILLNTFTILNEAERNYNIYLLYFQIKLSKNLGFSPELSEIETENETFFRNNEFYVNKSQLSSLVSVDNCPIENLDSINILPDALHSLIRNYERFLTNHIPGSKYYKSTKVFRDINYYN